MPDLRKIVQDLSSHVEAHLCAGDPNQAVAWSPDSEITVRLASKGDDEIWVIAGSGMLVRFITASDGDVGDVEPFVRAVLAGQAVEMFGPEDEAGAKSMIATGYRLGPKPLFAGGATEAEATWTARVAGPFAARSGRRG